MVIVVVVPFRESLRKKLGDVGKCDITAKSFSVTVLTVVQKETMIVPMGAVSSGLTFKNQAKYRTEFPCLTPLFWNVSTKRQDMYSMLSFN